MQCPMCGLELPSTIIGYHAWECNGREEPDEGSSTRENTVLSAQAACPPDVQQAEKEEPASPSGTSEIPHPDTERCSEKDEMAECPLCFRSIPVDLIIEHAAFCNGPSCGKLPEQAILDFTERVSCDPSEGQGQEVGAGAQPHSQTPGSSVFPEVTRNVMQVFHSYVSRSDAVVSRETAWSVEPKSGQEDSEDSETSESINKLLQYLGEVQKCLDSDPELSRYVSRNDAAVSRETTQIVEPKSGQEDNETSENNEKLLQYLGEVQRRLDNDPRLNQLLRSVLKGSRPLEILQYLIKSIFGEDTAGNVTPFALFFYLVKTFLPRFNLMSCSTMVECSKKRKYERYFTPDDTEVYPCLIGVKNNDSVAHCAVCNSDFSFAHGGLKCKRHVEILEIESWTALSTWLGKIIPDVVVPWITRMGGWGAVLALLGSVIAGGLLVGITIKLLKS